MSDDEKVAGHIRPAGYVESEMWKRLDGAVKEQWRDRERVKLWNKFFDWLQVAAVVLLAGLAGFDKGVWGVVSVVTGFVLTNVLVTWWRLRGLRKEEQHGNTPPI